MGKISPVNTPRLIKNGPNYKHAGLIHRVQEPEGFGPFPTILLLHGWKGNEDVMWIFQRRLPKDWLLVAPRAILNDPEGGYTWYEHRNDWPDLDRFAAAKAASDQFITALPELYDADLDNLYLMGFSQGAGLATALAIQEPTRFQGLVNLVGFAPRVDDNLLNSKPLLNMPSFMSVGLRDERIPLKIAGHCRQTLLDAGAELTYREYDTGHRLNRDGMRDLASWWADQL